MDWDKTQAKRVCEACFGGDIKAMRDYAQRYVAGKSMEPLGQRFRAIILNRNRMQWWKAALRQIDAHLGSKLRPVKGKGLAYNFPVLIEQDEDGWYIGTVPSLIGCHTQARTLPELHKRVNEAVRLWLDVNSDRPELNDFVGVYRLEIAT